MHQQNRRADQDQRTSMHVFHASLQEDAVCPHAHVPGRRKITLLSAFVVHYGFHLTNRFSSISIA